MGTATARLETLDGLWRFRVAWSAASARLRDMVGNAIYCVMALPVVLDEWAILWPQASVFVAPECVQQSMCLMGRRDTADYVRTSPIRRVVLSAGGDCLVKTASHTVYRLVGTPSFSALDWSPEKSALYLAKRTGLVVQSSLLD